MHALTGAVDREVSFKTVRPEIRGKFIYIGDEKFTVKGVTYGTFATNPETGNFPPREQVQADFSAMAGNGINAVRVYIIPPAWLLDLALDHGLRVFVGLPWEQHVAFLSDGETPRIICERLTGELRQIARHPAILAYAIGNEIPAPVVRWHGARKVERFLAMLCKRVRDLDPQALVTYVNFPTTEYLNLPFVDFVSFNVYLEDMERLSAYLARLQNIAGEKPLLMAELGLDSMRNGVDEQARSLRRQLETVFEAGVVGTFVFSWTDEWHRGGQEILDWDFGLVTRDRQAKPALTAVRETYATAPLAERRWPRFSVVLCSYNGARLIGETLEHLMNLDYPDYEVIVVDDGSTDATAAIARRFPVRLISTHNRGLSSARNTGLAASSGRYVAYIDDDAYPDPHWLSFLALSFATDKFAAVGGPNIAPPQDGDLAECVANAPGGPVQVLCDDEIAEHIPGCNMAFRADALLAIGGFDPQFRTAGDDVDACWRIMDAGGVIGFNHAAVVWHHRRPSLGAYFRQQRGYAKAEALVARKWPQKYNRAGHMSWHGRLYGRGLLPSLSERQTVYHGVWGSAPFQSIYQRSQGTLSALPQMPEWYFIVGLLIGLGALGFDWPPLLIALALGMAGLGISIAMALKGAARARFNSVAATPRRAPEWQLRLIVFWLHLLQPLMRLVGRIQHRLGPWSSGTVRLLPLPRRREVRAWPTAWAPPESHLERMRGAARREGVCHATGGAFDDWDLAIGLSIFGETRVRLMHEEHGSGQQQLRIKSWPVVFAPALVGCLVLAALGAAALADGALRAGTVLGILAATLALTVYSALSSATLAFDRLCRPVLEAAERPAGAMQQAEDPAEMMLEAAE